MKSILLIDDDPGFRALLNRLLVTQGWNVMEAEDGEEGLKVALEHRPRVVLCDLLMPRCNGFQVCRSLRSNRDLIPQPKIVVTTGSGYASDRLNALEAGADDYLIKPIKPDQLFRKLEELIATIKPVAPNSSQNSSDSFHGTKLKFWGVRGSVPTPGPTSVYYGGNTSCVEVRADNQLIILDAGTGIRLLGLQLAKEFKDHPLSISVLITHTHWDHIQGFPFFIPAYNPRNQVSILGYEGARKGFESILMGQMESPYFPISMQEMPGNITIQELKDMQFKLGEVQVQVAFMNHPGICVGYRLNTQHGSIAYMPDNELYQRLKAAPNGTGTQEDVSDYASNQDQKLIDFIKDADVVILDSQYDSFEYGRHVNWGHSCVDDSVALALKANVKQLFLFHHDPGHDDETISRFVAHARELVNKAGATMKVEAAREGCEVILANKPAEIAASTV